MQHQKEIIIQILHKGAFKRAWAFLDDPSKPNPRIRSVWPSIKAAKIDLYAAFILEVEDKYFVEKDKALVRFIDCADLFSINDDDPVLAEARAENEALGPTTQKILEEAKNRIALKNQS